MKWSGVRTRIQTGTLSLSLNLTPRRSFAPAERARFSFQQAQQMQMMALSQQSKAEYDCLLAEYYTLRVRHQTVRIELLIRVLARPGFSSQPIVPLLRRQEMLRLNQVLYLNSQCPTGPGDPQNATDMAIDELARPVLVGINTNQQVEASASRKRAFFGYEEGENKRGRDNE